MLGLKAFLEARRKGPPLGAKRKFGVHWPSGNINKSMHGTLNKYKKLFSSSLKNNLVKKLENIGYEWIEEMWDEMKMVSFAIPLNKINRASHIMIDVAMVMHKLGYKEYIDTELNVAYLIRNVGDHAFFTKDMKEFILVDLIDEDESTIFGIQFQAYSKLPIVIKATDE